VETKPYRIQSPEDIAKDYGGNKQKIAQAMQMGVVDPTAGVLAGMFIDRMRSAQMQEMAPQPSVAQQVMGGAPQAPGAVPPGGLGMTPPAALPMAPGIGAPPMGDMPMGAPPMGAPPAPPMGDMPMGAPPMGAPPMGAPPMGMADGGLAALPVPDNMFGEPMDGSYADGGIVSFAESGLTSQPDYDQILREDMAYYRDPQNFMRDINAAYQPKREYAERANQANKDLLSEEGQKKRSKQNKNSFLMDFGAKLASTRGPLLSAAGKAARKTLPGYQENVKEQRAEVRDALKQLAADEGMTNAEQRAFVLEGMKGRGQAGEIAKGFVERKAAKNLAELNAATDIRQSQITAAGNLAAARETGAGYGRSLDKQAQQQVFAAVTSTLKEVEDLYAADKNYSALAREHAFNPDNMSPARKQAFNVLEAKKRKDIYDRLSIVRTTAPPGTEGAFDRVLKQVGAQGATGSGGGSFKEGQTSRDRQGRPIVYQQGSWVYAD